MKSTAVRFQHNASRSAAVLFFALAFSATVLTSCSKSLDNTGFLHQLDIIDSCIARNQTDEALSQLKKAEKKAISEQQRLSIVKRYNRLMADNRSQDFLKDSVKKLPDSIALTALYTESLMNKGRYAEALPYAQKLKDSAYESLYAQLLLMNTDEDGAFYQTHYIGIYEEAYRMTHDSRWLKNAALLTARDGDIKKAASYTPRSVSAADDPYFWALINYYAGFYGQCTLLCDAALDTPYRERAQVLCSDAYIMMGEIEEARRYWEATIAACNKQQITAPKEIYKNLARYYVKAGNLEQAKDTLFALVTAHPDYAAGLADYGNFALLTRTSSTVHQMYTENLQSHGIETLAIQAASSLPSIPVSDALYRIETAIENNTYDDERLLLSYTRLRWDEYGYSEDACKSDIWHLLEENRDYPKQYTMLTRFAISWFLRHHQENTALSLFNDFCADKYGTIHLEKMAASLADWECETAAYFALRQNDIASAQELYENYLFNRHNSGDTRIALNLGALYQAINRTNAALELYSTAAGLETNQQLLSDVHYRIAGIQNDRGEKRNALLSVTYSLQLNPDNYRARLLYNLLNN
ncbi:MAG: hypothetical protein MJ178_01540 [Treponemataceae bacterium]|nr:hypothetical protein [Treponemataceae bacterium]